MQCSGLTSAKLALVHVTGMRTESSLAYCCVRAHKNDRRGAALRRPNNPKCMLFLIGGSTPKFGMITSRGNTWACSNCVMQSGFGDTHRSHYNQERSLGSGASLGKEQDVDILKMSSEHEGARSTSKLPSGASWTASEPSATDAEQEGRPLRTCGFWLYLLLNSSLLQSVSRNNQATASSHTPDRVEQLLIGLLRLPGCAVLVISGLSVGQRAARGTHTATR